MGTECCAPGLVVLCAAAALAAQERPGSVSGIVVDALHEPLPAVEVVVTSTIDDSVLGKAITDGSGAFLVSRLPVGVDDLRASARTAERAVGITMFRLLPDQPHAYGKVVRLYDAGRLTGRVVDGQGRPLAGIRVDAVPESGTLGSCGRHGITDGDGRFAITRVPLGGLTVCAFEPGYALGQERLRLRDQAQVELRLAAEPEQLRRRVRVLGMPPGELTDLRIRVFATFAGTRLLPPALVEGRPDASGEWTFVQLAGCRYRDISVSSSTLTMERRSAPVPSQGEATIDFRVVRSTLHGRLLGPDGAPLAGETIVCRSPIGGLRNLTQSGDDGRFEVASPVAPGNTCWLYLIDGRYVADQDRSAPLVERLWGVHQFEFEPSTTVILRAIPAAHVHATIVDASGPVRGANVRLCVADPTDPARVYRVWPAATDRDGCCRWNRIRAGDQQMWIEVDGHAGAGTSERLTLEAGRRVEVEVRARPAAVVEGKVVDAESRGVPGAQVRLRLWNLEAGTPGTGYVIEVLSDRDGRYRHVGVQPGGYRLAIVEDGKTRVETEPFACKSGQKVDRELTMR